MNSIGKNLDTNNGLFIVFEGLDGSGTSTQARLLNEFLLKEAYQVYLTSEPTLGPVGNLIRLAMSHRLFFSDEKHIDDRQLAYLFAADRYDHLYNKVDGILNKLRLGSVVISTRYYLSSFAYHCNSADDFELIRRLNAEFPPADITFFIECPVETCLERITQTRYMNEKYENYEKLGTVQKNYRRALDEYEYELHVLSGLNPIETLSSQIHEIVKEKLCAKR